jgi:pilus assembly protein CpaC
MENRVVPRGRVGSVEQARDADAAAREASPPGSAPANRTTFAGSNQIMLRVRFAEVARNDLFRLGVNWNNFLSSGNFLFGFATGGFLPGAIGTAGESFGQGRARFSDGSSVAEGLIDALRREGIVTVLAEPNLTAVSGETASFLAGGELPIPVPQADRIVTVQFKPFGVSLAFTPTLLPGNRIGLRVRPEVSTLAPSGGTLANGFFVPALTVRRAETTVELASGQTMAIAGLFQRNLSDGLDAIPGLGDMPILGKLFRSQRYQRDETELVIMITPILVQPVSDPRLLRTPLDPPPSPPPRVAATAAGFILR